MTANQNYFYKMLSPYRGTIGSLIAREGNFKPVPEDWCILITDIRNSTGAVAEGKHETINLVATGCIVAVLNALGQYDTAIPFFFGGDGATFLIPSAFSGAAMHVMEVYREQISASFGLDLRTGMISVRQIYTAGEVINIAKYAYPDALCIPVVLGNGLTYAEKLIKGSDALLSPPAANGQELDLSGMQCRWDRIPPPEDKEEVVTLLIIANRPAEQQQVYARIMDFLDKQYGYLSSRRPLSEKRLKMNATLARLKNEMLARQGKVSWTVLVKDWLTMLYGYIFFRTANGRYYLRKLVEMSDTLVIDGKINTVISGSLKQRTALTAFLEELESQGSILFGMHVSSDSIMSCYVRDLRDGHIHFVDGSEGGYTQAAKMLKQKIG